MSFTYGWKHRADLVDAILNGSLRPWEIMDHAESPDGRRMWLALGCPSSGETTLALVRIDRENGGCWGYSLRHEAQGLTAHDCPERMLDLVSCPPLSLFAATWRKAWRHIPTPITGG